MFTFFQLPRQRSACNLSLAKMEIARMVSISRFSSHIRYFRRWKNWSRTAMKSSGRKQRDGWSSRKTSKRVEIDGRSHTLQPCRCTLCLNWGISCWLEQLCLTWKQRAWNKSQTLWLRTWPTTDFCLTTRNWRSRKLCWDAIVINMKKTQRSLENQTWADCPSFAV